MPSTKRTKPLYQRGEFKLYPRSGRKQLEIVWYDSVRKRERGISAGTGDHGLGRLALDRLYLQSTGSRICGECGRAMEHDASPLLLTAIADYLLLSEAKAGYKSTRSRLTHVIEYVAASEPTVTCAQISPSWIDRFRKWLAARPVVQGNVIRPRSLSHIEQCVLQLAAAINATPGQRAQFRNMQLTSVAASPEYRADVGTIARMFRFCLYPPARSDKERETRVRERSQLLLFLRAAVATWARPAEIYDLADDRQWNPSARVLNLNPPGRRQTRKYRTRVPVPRQFAPFLNAMNGPYLSVSSLRAPWAKAQAFAGCPDLAGEAGEKLIRRSMATIARRRIGEANWVQGQMMLGHVKHDISDIYALPDPANLGLALAVTEQIIDEIEALCPGAYSQITASSETLKASSEGLSGRATWINVWSG